MKTPRSRTRATSGAAAALALISLISASAAQAQAPDPGTDRPTPVEVGPVIVDAAAAGENITDQIIIKYRGSGPGGANGRVPNPAQLNAEASDVLGGESLAYGRALDDGAHVIKLSNKIGLGRVRAIAARFAAQADVEYAEPDLIMQPVLVPNDTEYPQHWNYFAPTPGVIGANLPAAWDITTGASTLVIAVLDTGQLNHVDLAGRFVQGYDMISDSRIGNDGTARDNDPSDPGDWITSAEAASGFFAGCQVRNSSWHGTHVAGTIGANGNNASGVTGINWQSKIQHVRVLGKCGGYSSDIADGIRWAAGLTVSGVPANATPARVINMSLGGSGACSTTYSNAINAANNAGTVVVVAAGNSNADAANYSPASCANVITVASTGKAGSRAYYSNFGATVEIAAPGGDKNADANDTILSTLNTGTTSPVADSYVKYQGTSMATPHVVGLVSLMLSVNPSLNTAQVTSILQSTATAFPAGSTCSTSTCGPGIINAAAAVAQANGGGPTPPGAFGKASPANGASNQATSLALSWGSSSGASSYEYCLDTTNNNACDTSWTSVGTATSANASGLANSTTYYWQARAVNATGNTEANAGAWWSFSTQAAAPGPGAFNKTNPANGATGVGRRPTLRWTASSGATSYEYCVDTTNDNVCNGSWVNVGNVLSRRLPAQLPRGVTHFWQVRAVNASGTTEANTGTWWQFTVVN